MLYHFLYPLREYFIAFNVFRYITFRTIYAMLTALAISYLLGPVFIRFVKRIQIRQFIREEGPASHQKKAGTPTMGGMLILFSITVSTLLWTDLTNPYIWIILCGTLGFGAIGLIDDILKTIRHENKGLGAREKFAIQIIAGLIITWIIYSMPGYDTKLHVPFFKNLAPELSWMFIPFATLVIVGASNAVNLTDGLDGLAIGPGIIAAATYTILSYVSSHAKIASYLQVAHMPGCGEIAIFCGALVGASVGFLWYNAYPAQIFMGDVGSLSIGSSLGIAAIITKHELLLVLVCGLFVVEALSVIIQVGYFKISNGKRIFRMAPLHHHFELKGWAEPKVIVRFWIISAILALLSLSTLKLR